MDAHTHTIRQVFSDGGYIQYLLPHFQREYTWGGTDWNTLLEDVYTIYHEYAYKADGADRNQPEHFIGSLVRISNGVKYSISSFTLVDGQQRLTTISLILCALCAIVREHDSKMANRIARMLINSDVEGLGRYKLLPTTKHGDRVAYLAIVDAVTTGTNPDKVPDAGSAIFTGYRHLYSDLRAKIDTGEIEPEKCFATLLGCLAVVTIDLKLDEQPYKIFESLNAKGKPLTPADLVRNYVAMTLPPEMQDSVFEQQWAVIDDLLQEQRPVGKSGFGELTGFLRHYLASITGTLYNENQIYARFRDRARREYAEPTAFVTEIGRLRRFAEWYDRLLRPEHEPDVEIARHLHRLLVFETSTAFPFLLRAFEARSTGAVTREQWS